MFCSKLWKMQDFHHKFVINRVTTTKNTFRNHFKSKLEHEMIVLKTFGRSYFMGNYCDIVFKNIISLRIEVTFKNNNSVSTSIYRNRSQFLNVTIFISI